MFWKALFASVAGSYHKSSGIPCQDYAGWAETGHDILIGVVADGAGYARHADSGARVAVETTLGFLRRQEWPVSAPSEAQRAATAKEVVATVQASLQEECQKLSCALTDLAATLLTFVATPTYVLGMQIGDGFMVARRLGEPVYALLCQPQHGEYANETIFTISPDAAASISICIAAGEYAFVCAASDGLEGVALSYPGETPFEPFFRTFDDHIEIAQDMEEAAADVSRFLDSPRLNARTPDDKTLLLCRRVR
jgi:hypothetical protein